MHRNYPSWFQCLHDANSECCTFRSAQQTLLHTDSFTHKPFYTQTILQTNALMQRRFCATALLHTDLFTHKPFCTQTLLHVDTFTHRCFYTQMLLQTLLHTNGCFIDVTATSPEESSAPSCLGLSLAWTRKNYNLYMWARQAA